MTTANLTASTGGAAGVDPSAVSSATAASLSRRPSHRHRRGSSSWSVRSWDSHAHYQDFPDEDDEEDEDDEVDMVDGLTGGLFPSR